MQQDPRKVYVAEEMQQEALIYTVLSQIQGSEDIAPTFHGISRHLGVTILCIGREGSDFEDIGIKNISMELMLSAVESMKFLSDAGILHGDIALRNIVQSKENPCRAKIIDFGRSEFSTCKTELQLQVQALKQLLGLHSRAPE